MSTKSRTEEYLTKAIIKRVVGKGLQQASQEAMVTAGSLVEARDGWLVRRFKDGRIQRIEQLPTVTAQEIQSKVEQLGR